MDSSGGIRDTSGGIGEPPEVSKDCIGTFPEPSGGIRDTSGGMGNPRELCSHRSRLSLIAPEVCNDRSRPKADIAAQCSSDAGEEFVDRLDALEGPV